MAQMFSNASGDTKGLKGVGAFFFYRFSVSEL
jgi:hypothetical protein